MRSPNGTARDAQTVLEVVRTIWQDLARFDRDKVAAILAPDCMISVPGMTAHGRDEFVRLMRWLRIRYSNISVSERSLGVTEEGEAPVARGRMWLVLTTKDYHDYDCEVSFTFHMLPSSDGWRIQSADVVYLAGETRRRHCLGNFLRVQSHAKELAPRAMDRAA